MPEFDWVHGVSGVSLISTDLFYRTLLQIVLVQRTGSKSSLVHQLYYPENSRILNLYLRIACKGDNTRLNKLWFFICLFQVKENVGSTCNSNNARQLFFSSMGMGSKMEAKLGSSLNQIVYPFPINTTYHWIVLSTSSNSKIKNNIETIPLYNAVWNVLNCGLNCILCCATSKQIWASYVICAI